LVDIYEVVINDPIYLAIAVLLAISVVFSIIRKLFKFAVIIIACIVIYIGYLHYSGSEVPQTMDELIEGIEEKTVPAADKLLKGSEELINKADKLLKDKTP
jgi:uncharacterized protein YoxC